MRYTKIEIKNFKGINHLEIDFEKKPNGQIFPLVGLNESGKTTILEAINFLQNPNHKENGKKHTLIHKKKKDNFNEKISVKATLELDESDKNIIDQFLTANKLKKQKEINSMTIEMEYTFKNSEYKDEKYHYNIPLFVKTERQKNYSKIDDYNHEHKLLPDLIDKLELPKILYFENFLFDFPDKIYLEEISNSEQIQGSTQEEYRRILQDILDSLDGNLELNTHILDRIKSNDNQNKEALKQVLNKMSGKLEQTIIKSWESVFTESAKKTIEIESGNDENGYYLQFKIKEGDNSFAINERSLGFRWFFGFLLFTEFRKARAEESGEYLFLFDEPASNLHQSHQQKLLKLFEKLTDKSKIIYSTHNSYLLSPKFLLNTFIVKDKGMEKGIDNFNQNITATLYKTFVGDCGEKNDGDFKPILDVLDHVENPFEVTDNIVFFEGKNDYYAFKWIKDCILQDNTFDFRLYPGAGVTSYENIFREYLAHNRKFIAIFDADEEGKKAKKRYIDDISQELENNIFTLNDLDEKFTKSTESLFTESDKLKLQQKVFSEGAEYNKKHFNVAIQELFIKGEKTPLSQETKTNFKKIFDFIKDKFEQLKVEKNNAGN